jgi:membrane associated rhomboid family serine protease
LQPSNISFRAMLSDRTYMRGGYPRRNTSVVIWLVSALLAAFVLELVLLSPWLGSSGQDLVGRFPLSRENLQNWHLWTLFTHSFLHSPGNPFHIIFSILLLIFIGRELEPLLGGRRLLAVYAGAILLGALGWTAVHWTHGGAHIGAGAGIIGLLVVLAGLLPELELGLFMLPGSFRPKHLIYTLLALDAFGLFFYEILGASAPLGLTPSAHLGGMLAGWIYLRFVHARQGQDRAAQLTLPGWLRTRPKLPATGQAATTPPPGRTAPRLSAEVDRILDKINSQGFGSLTGEERRRLDEAKDQLSRR